MEIAVFQLYGVNLAKNFRRRDGRKNIFLMANPDCLHSMQRGKWLPLIFSQCLFTNVDGSWLLICNFASEC